MKPMRSRCGVVNGDEYECALCGGLVPNPEGTLSAASTTWCAEAQQQAAIRLRDDAPSTDEEGSA
ncbi:hypothetical protein [Paraconexibacter algicola]|uniref:Uncharacterized protein n=1 Tax=Paraconexibacter algicola TaxID=2133960 RepID=A0A2T4UE08_9ACTN|nr:hypothetical protein [Paraconexibacter algicola]PTL55739.1 hypothetical protein C7Y72_19105 [Paraconexibacter algicola]